MLGQVGSVCAGMAMGELGALGMCIAVGEARALNIWHSGSKLARRTCR